MTTTKQPTEHSHSPPPIPPGNIETINCQHHLLRLSSTKRSKLSRNPLTHHDSSKAREALQHAHLPLQRKHPRPRSDAQRPSQIYRRDHARVHQRRGSGGGNSAWWCGLGVGMHAVFHFTCISFTLHNYFVTDTLLPKSSTHQQVSRTSTSARRLAHPRGTSPPYGTLV